MRMGNKIAGVSSRMLISGDISRLSVHFGAFRCLSTWRTPSQTLSTATEAKNRISLHSAIACCVRSNRVEIEKNVFRSDVLKDQLCNAKFLFNTQLEI